MNELGVYGFEIGESENNFCLCVCMSLDRPLLGSKYEIYHLIGDRRVSGGLDLSIWIEITFACFMMVFSKA